MQPSHIEILKLAAGVVATIVVTLLWVHGSKQKKVDRSAKNSFGIVLRLLLVHAVLIYILCHLFALSANTYLIVTAVAYCLAAPASWALLLAPADDIIGWVFATVVLILVGVVYVLKLFVLGFPDRDLVCLVPPESVPLRSDPPPRQSDVGVVVSALRPMGAVELAGERFDATSASGEMIQVGTPIRVCGQRGNLYVVAVNNTGKALTASQ